jgi:hypothetical protein
MVWLFPWLGEESSSGESSIPCFRSIGQFLFSRLLSSLADSALMSGFSWVTVLVWCLLLFLFDGVLNGRYSKIGVECGVRDVPWCICYHS